MTDNATVGLLFLMAIIFVLGFLAGYGVHRAHARLTKSRLTVALAKLNSTEDELVRTQGQLRQARQWIDDTQDEIARGVWERT